MYDPGLSYSSSLCLSFLICKSRIVTLPPFWCWYDNWAISPGKALKIIAGTSCFYCSLLRWLHVHAIQVGHALYSFQIPQHSWKAHTVPLWPISAITVSDLETYVNHAVKLLQKSLTSIPTTVTFVSGWQLRPHSERQLIAAQNCSEADILNLNVHSVYPSSPYYFSPDLFNHI